MINILAIAGSLRAASLNAMLLRALAQIAPSDIRITLFQGLSDLPLFNPDLEFAEHAAVANLKAQIHAADTLVIASPEYAHGVTGVMKNALDWLVGSEALVYKPVVVLNASPRATHADTSLRETLTVMSASIIESASITLPIVGSGLTEATMVHHPAIATALQNILQEIKFYLKVT